MVSYYSSCPLLSLPPSSKMFAFQRWREIDPRTNPIHRAIEALERKRGSRRVGVVQALCALPAFHGTLWTGGVHDPDRRDPLGFGNADRGRQMIRWARTINLSGAGPTKVNG